MDEVVQGEGGGIAEAAVDGGDLDDGAAGGDEPMEAFAQGEAGDGAGGGVCGADFGEGFEVFADEGNVEIGPEGVEARLVDVDAGFEELAREAEEDDAGVDELFALDAGDDAEDGVIKRDWREHGWPPERRAGMRRDGG